MRAKDWIMTENPSEAHPRGGELTTELGCRILVIPPELSGGPLPQTRHALVLAMGVPDGPHYAEVLLTDAERARLKEIL